MIDLLTGIKPLDGLNDRVWVTKGNPGRAGVSQPPTLDKALVPLTENPSRLFAGTFLDGSTLSVKADYFLFF